MQLISGHIQLYCSQSIIAILRLTCTTYKRCYRFFVNVPYILRNNIAKSRFVNKAITPKAADDFRVLVDSLIFSDLTCM